MDMILTSRDTVIKYNIIVLKVVYSTRQKSKKLHFQT